MHYFGASLLTILGLVHNLRSVEINNITNRWPSGPRAKLDISPKFVDGLGQKLILRKRDESLNMTCTVVPQHSNKSDISLDYEVVWKVPSYLKESRSYILGQHRNIAWLWFDRLSDRDAGDYVCQAVTSEFVIPQVISINIRLSIRNAMVCGDQWFNCSSNNHCIMQRYVCDGKIDCAKGEDELGCGVDPCVGRVLCNGRCVSPEWCCGHRNCTSTYGLRPWLPETPEISYVQTAFYTVIGCAMAFMFIVTILVIAICRVQIKRAMNSRWTQQNRTSCNRRRTVPLGMPIYDLDVYLNRTADNYPSGVSIMYNINSGVQFVGRPVEPPPYSEVVAPPPREGPPPPYVSCENLIEQAATAAGEIPENITTHHTDSLMDTSNSNAMANPNNDLREEPPVFSGVVITSRSIPGPQVPTVSHISSTNSNINNSSNTTSPRTLPQTFDLEYVETDALLSDNANITITSPKETVWKTYSRPGNSKNRWQDSNNEKRWYQRKSDSKSVESSPLRNKDLSLADSENEGVFLETDQQETIHGDSGPSTSIPANERDENVKRADEPNDQMVDSSTLARKEIFPANPSQITCVKEMNESSTDIPSPTSSPSDPPTEISEEISASESLVLPLRESFIGLQKNS